MIYLLDTNICIYIICKRPIQILEKIEQIPPHQICLSAISLGELAYGVSKSDHREQNQQALIQFASGFNILDFNSTDAEIFGIIRAYLERQGKVIIPYDLQIAVQALSRNLILVTNNTKEFERVPGLKIENWII
jgi:tRNA(fMet)-specific endonuclease VapC